MQIFDTHAHLLSREFDADRPQVLREMQEKGVSLVMEACCTEKDIPGILAFTRENDFAYGALGLHPEELSLQNRMRCLRDLKDIGYQVGCGFMVGAPFQTPEMLLKDLRFLQAFQPHMAGIGPFIPHRDTPFRDCPPGTAQMTLRLLAIIRLMLPHVLLPATTALGTVQSDGRQRGMGYGANVVMPNLSPLSVRKKYALYDNKISTGEEAAESVALLKQSMAAAGYRVVTARGDWKGGEQ